MKGEGGGNSSFIYFCTPCDGRCTTMPLPPSSTETQDLCIPWLSVVIIVPHSEHLGLLVHTNFRYQSSGHQGMGAGADCSMCPGRSLDHATTCKDVEYVVFHHNKRQDIMTETFCCKIIHLEADRNLTSDHMWQYTPS